MADTIRTVSRSHLCLDIHLSLKLVILTVGQPTEAVVNLAEPRCGILPLNLLYILDGVESKVDIKRL